MKKTKRNLLIALSAALLSLGSVQSRAEAQAVKPAKTGGKAEAEAGDKDKDVETAVKQKTVTLNIAQGTVADALMSLSKQADIQLAISAEQADLQKTFTLLVSDKPAGDVLEIISATTNLEMDMQNGVLIVRSKPRERAAPKTAAAPSDAGAAVEDDEDRRDKHGWGSWRERFEEHHRFWKKRKKRVEFGSPVTVDKDDHLNTAVSIGKDTTVFGHLDRDAVSIGGNVFVKSGAVVEGTAVAVGGKVVIDPGAVVEDDAVAVGGKVEVSDKAVLEGDRVSIGIPMPSIGGIAGAVSGILILNALSAVARSVVLFAIALLLIWLIPARVYTVKDYMIQKPGISLLSGFLLFIALVPLFIVLALTIIGIPLIPVAAVALLALMVIGYTAVISWIGDNTPIFKKNRTPLKALIIGFVVFMLVNIVPVIGGIFLIITAFAGVGAAFQSRFGGREVV